MKTPVKLVRGSKCISWFVVSVLKSRFKHLNFDISVSHGGEYKDDSLLGYSTM
jgi:hypothetical protein